MLHRLPYFYRLFVTVGSQGCKTCIQSFFAFLVDIPKLVNGLKLNYNKVKPVAFISMSLEGSLYLLAKTSIICSCAESSMRCKTHANRQIKKTITNLTAHLQHLPKLLQREETQIFKAVMRR